MCWPLSIFILCSPSSLPWMCPSGWIPQLIPFLGITAWGWCVWDVALPCFWVSEAAGEEAREGRKRRPEGAEAVSQQGRMDTGRCCSFVCAIEAAPRGPWRLPEVFP